MSNNMNITDEAMAALEQLVVIMNSSEPLRAQRPDQIREDCSALQAIEDAKSKVARRTIWRDAVAGRQPNANEAAKLQHSARHLAELKELGIDIGAEGASVIAKAKNQAQEKATMQEMETLCVEAQNELDKLVMAERLSGNRVTQSNRERNRRLRKAHEEASQVASDLIEAVKPLAEAAGEAQDEKDNALDALVEAKWQLDMFDRAALQRLEEQAELAEWSKSYRLGLQDETAVSRRKELSDRKKAVRYSPEIADAVTVWTEATRKLTSQRQTLNLAKGKAAKARSEYESVLSDELKMALKGKSDDRKMAEVRLAKAGLDAADRDLQMEKDLLQVLENQMKAILLTLPQQVQTAVKKQEEAKESLKTATKAAKKAKAALAKSMSAATMAVVSLAFGRIWVSRDVLDARRAGAEAWVARQKARRNGKKKEDAVGRFQFSSSLGLSEEGVEQLNQALKSGELEEILVQIQDSDRIQRSTNQIPFSVDNGLSRRKGKKGGKKKR